MNTRKHTRKPYGLVLGMALAVPLALAQPDDSSDLGYEDGDIEELVVLGTRVQSGSVQDSPVPVDSIGGEDLLETGYPDVGLQLTNSLPSFNYSFSSITDGTDSVFPATLRGLDPDQTLVLVDGKRRHASALVHVNASVGRGSAGTDMNAIPSIAFERVDVLRDGASAIYGSDAIAGVMDMRLKRTSPATISLHAGGYSEGDGDATRVSFAWGGDISDTGTIFVAVESRERARTNRAGEMGTQNYPLLAFGDLVRADLTPEQQAEYDAYEPLYALYSTVLLLIEDVEGQLQRIDGSPLINEASSFGGYLMALEAYADALKASGNSGYVSVGNELSEEIAGLATIDADSSLVDTLFDDGCSAFSNFRCDPREFTLDRNTFRVGDPDTEQLSFVLNTVWQVAAGEVYANASYSTRENDGGCYYRQANDLSRNNVATYPDGFLPRIVTDVADFAFSAGYRWQTEKLQYDVSYSHGENSYDFGLVNSHNDSWGSKSPRSFKAGGPRYNQQTINFDGIYEVSDSVKVAFGAENRNEAYELETGEFASYAAGLNDDPANPEIGPDATGKSAFGSQCFPGFRPSTAGEGTRDNFSAYGEVGVQLDRLTLNGAARLESYSDFGQALTWRGAGLFKISDNFRVRGSLGTSLRAPSLPQLNYTTISTLSVDGELLETATLPNDHQFVRDLGIGELTEESSSNLSLGLAWQVSDSVSLTLDYYSIDIDDRIVLSGQVTRGKVEGFIEDATKAGDDLTSLNNLLAVFENNRISGAQFFFNAVGTETSGTDLVVEWQGSGDYGSLKLRATTNMTETNVVGGISRPGQLGAFAETDIFNYRDRSIIETWQPASKIILTADYQINQWGINAALRNFGEYTVSNTTGTDSQTFGAGMILDLRGTYNWQDRLSVALGMNNALDEYPDLNELTTTRAGTIKDIVDSQRGVFQYWNAAAPWGINGAYFYTEVSYRF